MECSGGLSKNRPGVGQLADEPARAHIRSDLASDGVRSIFRSHSRDRANAPTAWMAGKSAIVWAGALS